MLNATYYRKQAEICTRLASAAGSGEHAARFKVLALEMLVRAADAQTDLDEVRIGPIDRRNLPAGSRTTDQSAPGSSVS